LSTYNTEFATLASGMMNMVEWEFSAVLYEKQPYAVAGLYCKNLMPVGEAVPYARNRCAQVLRY